MLTFLLLAALAGSGLATYRLARPGRSGARRARTGLSRRPRLVLAALSGAVFVALLTQVTVGLGRPSEAADESGAHGRAAVRTAPPETITPFPTRTSPPAVLTAPPTGSTGTVPATTNPTATGAAPAPRTTTGRAKAPATPPPTTTSSPTITGKGHSHKPGHH